MSNIQELQPFNNACDEFISGKYILIDLKIQSILNIISNDAKLTNIVNSCLQDYDFNSQAKQHLINNRSDMVGLSLPIVDKEIVAFVYNMLYRFQSKTIDFYEFLKEYYNAENAGGKEFGEFARTIITPFKNAINSIYSKRHVLVETSDYQNNIYNKIITTIKLILKSLDNYRLNMTQKEEFTMLLNALHIASEKNDKKLVFSLMIGLDYFTKCNKKSRHAYLMLEECFERN